MKRVLLAIDVGGTNSRAYLVDEQGRCLGHGRGRGGNPASNDPEQAASAIISAVEGAVREANLADIDIIVALIALAGPQVHVARDRLQAAFQDLGLSGPIVFSVDVQALFASATTATEGYCVVAGTGAGVVRIRNGEIEKVVDGAGWLLGDLGSGFWLGHQAAVSVVAELHERGEKTSLTPALLEKLEIPWIQDATYGDRYKAYRKLCDTVYAMKPIDLARFAPLVIANKTDPVAARLIADAERYITNDFAVAFDPEIPGPVALGGGVAAHLPGLLPAIGKIIRDAGHEPDLRLVPDGSVGAVVLALRSVDIPVDEARFNVIAASLAEKAASAN